MAEVPQALTAGSYAFTVTARGGATLATVASTALADAHAYSIPTPYWEASSPTALTLRQVY